MRGEVMEVGYSVGRRDDFGLPLLTSLNLLVSVFVIIVLKGGNRKKHIFLSFTVVGVV